MTDAGEVNAVVNEAANVVEFKREEAGASPAVLAQLQGRITKIIALQKRLQAASRSAMLEHKYLLQLKGSGGATGGAGAGDALMEPSIDVGELEAQRLQGFAGEGVAWDTVDVVGAEDVFGSEEAFG